MEKSGFKTGYSEDELFQIARSCYDKLILHCQTLEVAGFWAQAEQVMQQKSSEVLSLYIQAVLMKLAFTFDKILGSQIRFIATIPCGNPLAITKDLEIDREFTAEVDKAFKMPPILIQLCSLYDKERHDDVTAYFVDSILNILQCMACLNVSVNSEEVNDFLEHYYNRVSYYILDRTAAEHTYYIAHKLKNAEIVCDVDLIRRAKEQAQMRVVVPQKVDPAPKYAQDIEWIDTEKEEPEYEEPEYEEPEEENGDFGNATFHEPEETIEERRQRMAEKRKRLLEEQKIKRAEREKQREENRKLREERKRQEAEQAKEAFLEVKERIKERELAEAKKQEERMKALLDELNGLVGLSSVKEEIRSLINLIKIRKLRARANMPELEMSYHMVFTGSPGTGKTTVARLVAKIYKELGILSEGNLIETDRSGLVAGYVGQTAIKVHEIVEQAIGGILFIDEAYSLVNPDVPNDFGMEAVDTLVKLMEDHRDNLVIIVAGYTKEMKRFLKSNSGLISRFNKFIDFPDYSTDELVEIMESMAEGKELRLDDGAKAAVRKLLRKKSITAEWENFGNARGIRNLFEKLVMNQANRLVQLEEPSKEELSLITKEDVVM